jgi:hypothetical protein
MGAWDWHSVTEPSLVLDGHYDLVSGFYGPGAVVFWLLAALAITITWSLRVEHHADRDTLSNEFVGFLLYPVIAAGHLVIQMSQFPGQRHSIWDLKDKQLLSQSASIRASNAICDIYMMLACTDSIVVWLLRFLDQDDNDRRKLIDRILPRFPWRRRSIAVGAVWLWCFIAEATCGLHGSFASFVWDGYIHGTSLFLILYYVLFLLVVGGCLIMLLFKIVLNPRKRFKDLRAKHFFFRRGWFEFTFFACVSFMCIVSMIGITYVVLVFTVPEQWEILIPRTSFSLKDLDQVLGLLAGTTTLIYSIVGVYNERKGEKSRGIVGEDEHPLLSLNERLDISEERLT